MVVVVVGGLGTTAVAAPAVQRPPLQLIYIKLCVALHREFSSIRFLYTITDTRLSSVNASASHLSVYLSVAAFRQKSITVYLSSYIVRKGMWAV